MIGKILKQSYPPPSSGLPGFFVSIGIGLFIGLFLLFFQPFDLNTLAYSPGETLLFGVITFGVFFFFHCLLPLLWPTIYLERTWTVWRQICFYLLLLLLIATLNGLYINYLNSLRFNWNNYLWITSRTIVLGIIPISIYVLLVFNWHYAQMVKNATQLNPRLQRNPEEPEYTFLIQTNLKEESFGLSDQDFLYAKADGNYLEIYRKANKPHIYRISLNKLDEQVGAEHLLRCHRSYFVNLKQVSQVTGNAQGLKLWFEGQEGFVPVSRKYIAPIRRVLNELSP